MKYMIVICLLAVTTNLWAADSEYQGSTFNDVWSEVTSDEYDLPQIKVNYWSLFEKFQSKIKKNATRTINERMDIMEPTVKLAHPNGICLSGVWKMTEESPYTGYFKQGQSGLFIGRASTAMNGTKRGEYRGMALAGKVFPTMNPDQTSKPGHFFLVDDLGGTKADNWTSVEMTNEPKVSQTWAVLSKIAYAIKLAVTFGQVDSNPNIRQTYEISELGESNPEAAVTPQWMMVKAAPNQNADEEDFRDELRMENHNGLLLLEVHAGSTKDADGNVKFQRVGTIEVTESIVSATCDSRLHFAHPKWKSDLNHQ